MQSTSPDRARVRIQIEYIQMPALRLTVPQISRLCDVRQDVCAHAVAKLVARGFLAPCGDGSFARPGFGRDADAIAGPASFATAS